MFKRIFLLITVTAACLSGAQVKRDTVPSWLDTVAPRVEIQPHLRYHSSVFHITLKSNEQAVLWMSVGTAGQMKPYQKPYTVTKDGALKIFYYGEDDYGNKSRIDSITYILDRKKPALVISPPSGSFRKGQIVVFGTDKACRLLLLKQSSDTTGVSLPESLVLDKTIQGYVRAIDSAGNIVTTKDLVRYIIDTASIVVKAAPPGGIYNKQLHITFSVSNGIDVLYTFDPLAPPKWFTKYTEPVLIPYGLSILRYYGRDSAGIESEISRTKYVLDTIPPKLHMYLGKGSFLDTIIFSSKEPSVIRYTLDGTLPVGQSPLYGKPLLIEHKGRCVLKARARDGAGNVSDPLEWECKYDTVPPVVGFSNTGGTFTSPQTVFLTVNEPSKLLYTLDRTPPSKKGLVYSSAGIVISREDSTILTVIGIDDAGNISSEKAVRFFLDTRPPVVKAQIEGTLQEGNFLVRLIANEKASIYYEVGDRRPDRSSPLYESPIPMKQAQSLQYVAVDAAGNATAIVVMDELKKPMVSSNPEGGVYNRKLRLTFLTSSSAVVYWRELPDTVYRPFKDTIMFQTEGSHSLEYYSEVAEGLRSTMRRSEYFLDWTPPRVNITVKKGIGDSVSIFFECSENATIYYTYDGSNPQSGSNAKMAGNKFLTSRDRISILRNEDVKLAFYAEDAAGNQSALNVLDVFKPRAVPNIPAGKDRVYDRILSVSFNTFDRSTVYWERHGKFPTTRSPVFNDPITLMCSDTLVAFAVDASGFAGKPDTFIFLIDLPPSPYFTLTNDSIIAGTGINFDASGTIDKESPLQKLLFRWDFDGDGKWNCEKGAFARTSHVYPRPGNYTPTLEVTDERSRTSVYSHPITVHERCPEGMVSVVAPDGHTFCIDRYEYPNSAGKMPLVKVSWVEAKMMCIDQGKRLCGASEWSYACNGGVKTLYPYGDTYDPAKCPSEGKNIWKSGSFKGCSRNGLNDMLGNAWEWTEDKKGDSPVMLGGTYKFGKDDNCRLQSSGTVATKADDVGFRCCK